MTPEEETALTDRAMKALGWFSHQAAMADACQYEAFHHIAGCKRGISRAIYFTLDSSNGRSTLVKRVAVATAADTETMALLKALKESIKEITDHRNNFAHSFLLIHRDFLGEDDHLRIVNPKHPNPGGQRVVESSLNDAEEKCVRLRGKVAEAFEAVCLRLGIRPTVSL